MLFNFLRLVKALALNGGETRKIREIPANGRGVTTLDAEIQASNAIVHRFKIGFAAQDYAIFTSSANTLARLGNKTCYVIFKIIRDQERRNTS